MKKIIILLVLTALLITTILLAAAAQTNIHYAGFESDSQGWIDGGGDSDRSSAISNVTDSGSPGGSFSWHLQDNSGTSYTEQSFDFTGYDEINVTWSAYYTSIEDSEALELRCDGAILWRYESNTEGTEDRWIGQNENQRITIYPSNCTFDSSVTLRFEAEFSGNGDSVYIDAINVTGITNTISDTTSPNITSLIPIQNSQFNISQEIEISANAADNTNISTVVANITLPNLTIIKLQLINSINNKYNSSYIIPNLGGKYQINIIANDTSNNFNTTETTSFIADKNLTFFQNSSLVAQLGYFSAILNNTHFNGTSQAVKISSGMQGNFTSQSFDAKTQVSWNNISWNQNLKNQTANTSLKTCSDTWGASCSGCTDNTFDSCSSSSCDAFENVQEVYINATTTKIGDKINVTVTGVCNDVNSIISIAYYNGTWNNIYSANCVNANGAENHSTILTITGPIGTQWIRGIDEYQGSAGITCAAGFDADNDDANITVVADTNANIIKFQARSDDDNSAWGPFIGPDGTQNTFYTNSALETLNITNNRYFQYKAFLETNSTESPELINVTISYSIKIEDNEFPVFSNFQETPLNNSQYSPSQIYQFNTTITSTNGAAGIEFNSINYTASNLSSSVFNVTITSLAAGTYSYYWHSYGNGTLSNYNTSQTRSYTINKATQSLTALINGINSNLNITYPQQINASYSGTNQTPFTIKINETEINIAENYTWQAGIWTMNYSAPSNQNYTEFSAYLNLTINKATPEINLTLNHTQSNTTIFQYQTILLNGTIILGDPTSSLQLYLNNSLINQNPAEVSNLTNFTSLGLHNITLIYIESQNYTQTFLTYYINVTQNPDTTPPDISIQSPTNTNYSTKLISLNTTSTASDIDTWWYTLNSGITNTTFTPNTTIAANEGSNTIIVYLNDTSNNQNSSSINFTIDTTPPYFEHSLQNFELFENQPFNYDINATDSGVGLQSYTMNDSNFQINSSGFITNATTLAISLYYLNITINDSLNNQNSSVFYVNVTQAPDTTPPYFTQIPENLTINYTQSIQVNFEAADNIALDSFAINSSVFIINSSGTLKNATKLAAGTYIINVTINDTSNNINSTLYQVAVTKAISICTIESNSPKEYPNPINVSASCTNPESNINLYRNNVNVNSENHNLIALGAGSYTYNVNTTQTQNYTNASASTSVTVNQNTTFQLSISATPSASTTYPTQTTVQGLNCPTELTCILYRNNTPVSNPEISTLGAGSYVYIYNTSGNTNYTSNSSSLTLTISQALSEVNLTLNSSSSNITINQGSQILLNGTLITGHTTSTLQLYNNGALINQNSVEASNLTTFNNPGVYNITILYLTDQNYSQSSKTLYITVNAVDSTPPYFTIIPTNPNLEYPQPFGVDFDADDETQFQSFSINWTSLFSINQSGWLTNTSQLNASTYKINITINDTSNNLNSTIFTLTINQNSSFKLNISITPSTSATYPTETTVQGLNCPDEITCTLYINNISISNPHTAILAAGNYTYEFNTSGNNNYISNSTIEILTVNQNTSIINLYLNHTQSNITIFQYQEIYLNATLTTGFPTTIQLYKNGTLINQGQSPISNLTNFTSLGLHNITAIFSENSNYTSASQTFYVAVISVPDTTPPSITSLTQFPQNNTQYSPNQIYQFNATISDENLNTVIMKFNNINYTLTSITNIYNFTITNLAAGTYNYTWYANDTSNNVNTTETQTYSVSKAGSNLTLLLNSSNSNITINEGNQLNISSILTTPSQGNVQIYNNNSLIYSGNSPYENLTTFTFPGIYNITSIYQGNNNYTSSSITLFVNVLDIDSENPTVASLVPVQNSQFNISQSIEISANAADNTNISSIKANITLPNSTSITLTLTNSQGNKYNNSYTIPNLAGRYNITFIANDTSNNINNTETTFFNVSTIQDTTPPDISIQSPTNTNYSTKLISLNTTSTASDIDTWWYTLNSGITNTTFTPNTTIAANEGSNTIIVYLNDTSNNINSTSITFFVDTTPPIISNVQNSSTSNQTSTIIWNTNELSNSSVNYGTTLALNNTNSLNDSTLNHSILLTSLTENTTYFYNVTSCDSNSNCNTSGVYNFTTSSIPDTTLPIISNVQASSITNQSVLILWNTNELSNSTINYHSPPNPSNASSSPSFTASHSIQLTNLTPNTTYFYNVTSCDSSNNCNTSTTQNFTTLENDFNPPEITLILPSNNSETTSTSITFEYNATDSSEISQCSIIINNITQETDTSIEKSEINSFTRTLSLGINHWKINCIDSNSNENNSTTWLITILEESSNEADSSSEGGASETSIPIIEQPVIETEIPLFDVKLELNKIEIIKEESLTAFIELIKASGPDEFDITINYQFTKNNEILFETAETRFIENNILSYRKSFTDLPLNEGIYKLKINLHYENSQVGSAETEFTIINPQIPESQEPQRTKTTGFVINTIENLNLDYKIGSLIAIILILIISTALIYKKLKKKRRRIPPNRLKNIKGIRVYTTSGIEIGKIQKATPGANKIDSLQIKLTKKTRKKLKIKSKVKGISINYKHIHNISDIAIIDEKILGKLKEKSD